MGRRRWRHGYGLHGRRWRSLGGILEIFYGFNARVGAVATGLEHAMLCVAEAASSTASGGCEAWGGERGCLAVSLDGGDCVCTWRGRRAVCGRVLRVVLWHMLGMVDRGTGAA